MNKDKFRKPIFQITVTLCVLVVLVYYLYENYDKYFHLLNISAANILFLFALSVVFPILNGFQNSYWYRDMGLLYIPHHESILITAASTLVNQLPVPGGIISRGYYLKTRYGLSYMKYANSTISLFICYLAINGLVGIFALMFRMFVEGGDLPFVLFAVFLGMIGSFLLFFLPVEKLKLPQKLRSRAVQFTNEWIVIRRYPGIVIKLAVLQIALVLLLSLRYWIAFRMVSQYITFGQALLLASASILTQLVSIAPGGLGVREVIVAGVGSALGFDAAYSVVAIGLDRLVFTVMVFLTGWISILILRECRTDQAKVKDQG